MSWYCFCLSKRNMVHTSKVHSLVLIAFSCQREIFLSLSLILNYLFILLLSTQHFQFYQFFFAFSKSLFIKSNFFNNQLITLGKILRTATVKGPSFEHGKVCVSTPPYPTQLSSRVHKSIKMIHLFQSIQEVKIRHSQQQIKITP